MGEQGISFLQILRIRRSLRIFLSVRGSIRRLRRAIIFRCCFGGLGCFVRLGTFLLRAFLGCCLFRRRIRRFDVGRCVLRLLLFCLGFFKFQGKIRGNRHVIDGISLHVGNQSLAHVLGVCPALFWVRMDGLQDNLRQLVVGIDWCGNRFFRISSRDDRQLPFII